MKDKRWKNGGFNKRKRNSSLIYKEGMKDIRNATERENEKEKKNLNRREKKKKIF